MRAILLFLILTACLFASEKVVSSKVSAVTVFKEQALVKRQATLQLAKGEHTLVFDNLTTQIIDGSVRLETDNPFIKILDVKVELKHALEHRKAYVQQHKELLDSLYFEKQIIEDKIKVYENKRLFIEDLRDGSTQGTTQQILMRTASTKNWKEILNFVGTNLEQIYSGIRKEKVAKKKIAKQIKLQQQKMNRFMGTYTNDYKKLTVKIEALQPTQAKIFPTYMVAEAFWYPQYDARVSSMDKTIEITSWAMVQQTTGEDWKDITLTFSTSNPINTHALPELEPWFINTQPLSNNSSPKIPTLANNIKYNRIRQPNVKAQLEGRVVDKETGEPLVGSNVTLNNTTLGTMTDVDGYFKFKCEPGNHTLKINYVGYTDQEKDIHILKNYSTYVEFELNPSPHQMDAVVVEAKRPLVEKNQTQSYSLITMDDTYIRGGRSEETNFYVAAKSAKAKYDFSKAKKQAISTTFILNKKNSLPSDPYPHKITMNVYKTSIAYSHLAYPKLEKKVYLSGKMVNKSTYPFLAGEMNLFLNNNYVNKIEIDDITVNDSLKVALGQDENIKIERKLINKTTESTGFISSKSEQVYNYEIVVTNLYNSKKQVKIVEHLPIPMNKVIEVKPISPSQESGAISKQNIITWNMLLHPGETKKIPLKFKVIAPQNVRVYGLQ